MLELRPNCECCGKDLPPETPDAAICSFECTFCRECAETGPQLFSLDPKFTPPRDFPILIKLIINAAEPIHVH
jgi:wyosine [tRNA(Phe)-imidazoG37] synthetase (radical SAM superfamily)